MKRSSCVAVFRGATVTRTSAPRVRAHAEHAWPRGVLLAAAIGLALQVDVSAAGERRSAAASPPVRVPEVATVTNCADSGAGSLRDAIAGASSGDTIDMSGLTCGTISLTSGQIATAVSSLTIQGPGAAALTIDGGRRDAVFDLLAATGTTTIRDVSIANGLYDGGGGCVFVGADVDLERVTIASCTATEGGAGAMLVLGDLTMEASAIMNNDGSSGDGGGIDVEGNADISDSVINENSAVETGTFAARGGGLFVSGYLHMTGTEVDSNYLGSALAADSVRGGGVAAFGGANVILSTIENNTAHNGTTPTNAHGGGLYLFGGSVNLQYTTIQGNHAGGDGAGLVSVGASTVFSSTIAYNAGFNNAALVLGSYAAGQTAYIVNSTISGNVSAASSAIFSSQPLKVYGSTIAFNSASGTSAGLYLYPGGDADIESTIIANNTSSGGSGFDLVARATVTGSHDLILVPGATVPPDTIVGLDPLLSPLADHGGATWTLALMTGSPAIDTGNNVYGAAYDQRGRPYFRASGAAPDIGAYELQVVFDRIFIDGFD